MGEFGSNSEENNNLSIIETLLSNSLLEKGAILSGQISGVEND